MIVIILTAALNAITKTAFELQCSGVFEKRSNHRTQNLLLMATKTREFNIPLCSLAILVII